MVKCCSSSVTIPLRMVLKGSFGDDQDINRLSRSQVQRLKSFIKLATFFSLMKLYLSRLI